MKDRATCPFYEQLDAVLDVHASTMPVVLLESSQPSAVEEENPKMHGQYYQFWASIVNLFVLISAAV